jgi:hypothetical protein
LDALDTTFPQALPTATTLVLGDGASDGDGDGQTGCAALECDDADPNVVGGGPEILSFNPGDSLLCFDGRDNDCAGDGVDALDSDCQDTQPVVSEACVGTGGDFPALAPVDAVDAQLSFDICGMSDDEPVAPFSGACLGAPGVGPDAVLQFAIAEAGTYRLRLAASGAACSDTFRIALGELASNFEVGAACDSASQVVEGTCLVTTAAGTAIDVSLDARTAYALVLESAPCVAASACDVSVWLVGPLE